MFNWCFIGAGAIAIKVAREVNRSKTDKVYCVWNRTYQKSSDFSKEFNCIVYKDVEDALNDPQVDGVYIALTNDVHFSYMKKCIEHKKPILCEKPFTMNTKEADEIFRLANESGVYVSEAMWTWHNKIAYKVKEWIKDIGQIKEVDCTFSFIGTSAKRLYDPYLLGGALLDIGVYGLRYSLELFGMPKDIKCNGILSGGVDVYEEVIFIYDGFKVRHRFGINEYFGNTYNIIGEKATIEVPSFQSARKAYLSGDKQETITDNSDLYENQFANVSKEIKEGLIESGIITKKNTLLCMELMDECRKQMGLVYPYEK